VAQSCFRVYVLVYLELEKNGSSSVGDYELSCFWYCFVSLNGPVSIFPCCGRDQAGEQLVGHSVLAGQCVIDNNGDIYGHVKGGGRRGVSKNGGEREG